MVKSKVVEIYYTQGWEGVLLLFLVVVGIWKMADHKGG
ncbi:hypothetical protein bthur0014_67340 [Bacillus thuringiensis IBL 4222]|nr:hypothetical protein bthur0014_67340 [Bacillus thuringiensis IBL 4222]